MYGGHEDHRFITCDTVKHSVQAHLALHDHNVWQSLFFQTLKDPCMQADLTAMLGNSCCKTRKSTFSPKRSDARCNAHNVPLPVVWMRQPGCCHHFHVCSVTACIMFQVWQCTCTFANPLTNMLTAAETAALIVPIDIQLSIDSPSLAAEANWLHLQKSGNLKKQCSVCCIQSLLTLKGAVCTDYLESNSKCIKSEFLVWWLSDSCIVCEALTSRASVNAEPKNLQRSIPAFQTHNIWLVYWMSCLTFYFKLCNDDFNGPAEAKILWIAPFKASMQAS